jgi:dTDP-4-dehydrorhamnose 3,5-epimerase
VTDAAAGSPDGNPDLPTGVAIRQLLSHRDPRGSLTELYRTGWMSPVAAQWNLSRSAANVLRGVHVHLAHHDYLVFIDGKAMVGLRDLRRDSVSYGITATIALSGENATALSIPPGVAHGFCHLTETLHVYAMSEEWTPADDLGCRWDDPALGIDWPLHDPVISDRDASLPSLRDLTATVTV